MQELGPVLNSGENFIIREVQPEDGPQLYKHILRILENEETLSDIHERMGKKERNFPQLKDLPEGSSMPRLSSLLS